MLNPDINPLYRQVLYDGQKKTYIKTLQNHKNQIAHSDYYQWNNKLNCEKNSDKITNAMSKYECSPQYVKAIKPEDHKIFTPIDPIKQTQIPLKYQQRYNSQHALFPQTSPRITQSSAMLIGKFILNEQSGNYNQPPVQPPSETYRNRSQVFFG